MTVHAARRKPGAVPTERDPRWRAVVARDLAADGTFFYSVATTGVYCFPSCAARPAHPKNVRFFSTREDAEQAGFRPCKRCKPDQGGGKRQRAAREMKIAIVRSSLGLVLVAKSAKGISAVLFGDDRDALRRDLCSRFPEAALVEGDAKLEALAARVVQMVEAPARRAAVDLLLDLRGTKFQRAVWQALRRIPAGSTATYADVANRIGRPKSVRAVAQACAANALAVLVPCHRVVRSDGGLSGYRWGVARKKKLLAREAAA